MPASSKCKKNYNYIAAITDGELLENLKIYRSEIDRQKILIETCKESEVLDIQNRLDNLMDCYIRTIELLEEIGHYCKSQRDSI